MIHKLILVFISIVFLSSCKTSEEKTTPLLTAISSSVYVSVTVQPDSLYQVFSNVNGLLEANLVDEGNTVLRGMPIIQVVNTNPKLSSENANLSYRLAQKNYNSDANILNGIEEELKSANLKLKNDALNYHRQKNLWEQKIGSKAQYDAKKLEFELATHSLKALKNKYNRTKSELQNQLQQASNNYQTAVNTAQDFTISSKINGTVYALYKKPGEIVNTQQAIALVGSSQLFEIEMLVDEVDIVVIKIGQKVLITLDAYQGQVFTAVIDKVYPTKDKRNQTFKVTSRFKNPPKTLYPGLSGEGNIITAFKENVLTIPRDYLIEGNKVNTSTGLISVTVGLQNLERVEILSGISESTELIKPAEE